MKTLLILGILMECVVLTVLTILKKWTKQAFIIITSATAACCIMTGALLIKQKSYEKETDQRAYLYMAARLIEEDFKKESIEALSTVIDEKAGDYPVYAIRGLSYNLNGAYEIAANYMENHLDSETEQAILEASRKGVAVEEGVRSQITDETLESINASDAEARKWEAEMRIRYMGFQLSEEEKSQIDDELAVIKLAITENRYKDAYQQLAESQAANDIKNAVLISNMYVKNYNSRIISDGDKEYEALWNEASALQADLNIAAFNIQNQSTDSSEYEEYRKIRARYDLAIESLNQESAKRAIKYLQTFEDTKDSIGYQLQMARLYFMSNQIDTAKEYIEKIFTGEKIDTSKWLGRDAESFRQAYINYISDPLNNEYSILFDQLMSNLYQSVFEDDNYSSFKEFVLAYLHDLFGGLIIKSVDTSGYPQIVAQISSFKEDLTVDEKSLDIVDTKEEIKNYQVTVEKVNDLNLCFVLDRSGSMEGNKLTECKNAIRDCISKLEENVTISLVTFENSAVIDCGPTQSQYLVMNLIEDIQATGGTNISSGLLAARDSLSLADGSKVVILLSDGQDFDGSRNIIEDVISQAVAMEITVYTIGLPGCDEAYLQNIANKTGGQFIMVTNTGELHSVYQEIQTSLMKRYMISYTAVGEEEERNISIRDKSSYIQASRTYSLVEKEENRSEHVNGIQEAGYYKQTGGTEK